ncbi:amidohydrolase [Undibacterium sp. LX15W]|uniref:Amidohydrolase n=2 Tax=Undibacterium flavidum TaxID=2762297 RepID=A0ABR6YB36_9BURK|nr:amidohydrolase [Undibacterium flavidum]
MAQKPAADLIIHHAKIWTVDSSKAQAQAVAVLGDKIVAVGTNQQVALWRGSRTKMIDAHGKRVLPGFNDAHVHFADGGNSLSEVELKDSSSLQEFARRIAAHGASLPGGEWVLGGNWDDQAFTAPGLPTRQIIDAVVPERPVFVTRYDGHMAVANSLVLKLAGIDKQTPELPGGEIVRDQDGNPTGLLKDAAMDYVFKVMPEPSPEKRLRTIRAGLQLAAQLGVTSLQDMNPPYADIAAYAELAERGELSSRMYVAPMLLQAEDIRKLGIRHAFGSDFLRMGAVKTYADGSLGSSTAYFHEPYLDAPQTRGLLAGEMQPIEGMRERMILADKAGLQLCVHAIGDDAISAILDLFEDVVKANGERDRRFRIEHAQHMAEQDFARFAKLGVIASVQPYHAIDDGRFVDKRIGHARASRTYAFRSFLKHGVKLAIGTDWTVAPLDPMSAIHAAVTRATLDGQYPQGWYPEQKLTVAEVVQAYTMGSAYAEFQEHLKGSITPGKLADIVILSQDIFKIAPDQIKHVKVEKTLVGGKLVFERKD